MRLMFGLILLTGATTAVAGSPQDRALGGRSDTATLSRDLAAGEAGIGSLTSVDAADLSAADPALGKLMDRIEGNVGLPTGASPLPDYTRLYAWADKPRGKVTAIFLRRGAPGRKWVTFDDLPAILDGGCNVIELVYDVSDGRAEAIYCNAGR